jgi:hypothetical protein
LIDVCSYLPEDVERLTGAPGQSQGAANGRVISGLRRRKNACEPDGSFSLFAKARASSV